MRRLAAACLAMSAMAAHAVLAAPALQVEPPEVLEGQRVVVRRTGLAPGERVVRHLARLHDRYPAGQEVFRGRNVFVAGPDGTIDTATAAPIAGSDYTGIDPAGPFWSMLPVRREPGRAEEALRLGLADAAALAAGEVQLALEQGGRIVARARAMLAIRAPGVTVREVREAGVVGVHAQAAGAAARPAVLLLGGSEGGLFTARAIAPLLASRGYAVLGVGYFRRAEADLEALPLALQDVPLERLEAARRWLLAQPGVAPDRLAIVGVSKGAEMALLAAAHFPWVDAAAAFAPSHVVWEGIPAAGSSTAVARSSWMLAGRPLPFVPWSAAAEQRGERARRAAGASRLTEAHLESLAGADPARVDAARIPVERGRAALLLVAGVDDARWPSAYAAEQIAARLAGAGQAARLQALALDTGHLVLGTGWAPATSFQRAGGALQGGSARLDAAAQAQAWAALLAFLDSAIGRGGS